MWRRILDSPWTYFAAAGVLAVVAIASQFELRLPTRPMGTIDDVRALRDRDDTNLVFILIDTLRADRLGAYGYERNTSPVMDDLGKYGAVFDDVWSQSSWTKTSMVSIWTGTYPANHGVLKYKHRIPEAAVMPAEIFLKAGFRTAGIWRNGWVAPNFGFDQGFEIYHRPKPGSEQARIQRKNPIANPLQGTDEDNIKSAMEFLTNFGHERFFLYLHMMDVHQYVFDDAAAANNWGNGYSDAYDFAINWTDRLIGHLVERIDDLDLLKKTVIVIVADHGEAFLEHGTEGHARNLYTEVTKTPFIIAFPFRLDPGIRVTAPVANIDVLPTVLDLMGMAPLPNADGRSLVPLLVAGSTPTPEAESLGERPLFAELDRRWGSPTAEPTPRASVSYGDFHLLTRPLEPEWAELYQISSDPKEQENLAKSDPEKVAELRKLEDAHLEKAKSPWGEAPDEVELDSLKLEQLRALGYVIQ